MGASGEYRNGALMIQALDGTDVGGGFVLDVETQRYVAISTAIEAVHDYVTNDMSL